MVDETTLKEVAEKYKNGKTITGLVAEYGKSYPTIVNWLRKANVKMRPKGMKRAFTEKQAERLRERYEAGGVTQAKLAKETGHSEITIRKYLKKR